MQNNYRDSNDWKMFWIIENKDLESLKQLCQKFKTNNKNIGMYFQMASWRSIFTEEEAHKIKVYMCGSMDFCPVQHACDIGWIPGMKCLFDSEIGCNIQGCGLPIVNREKFNDYCARNPIHLL